MGLTINQALQQGIAAHKEGKLQDAERLYRAILQVQPAHPDANHNLGVLAVSVGKSLEAIPFFKLALETNPKVEQFWLSYIEALRMESQFDEAMQALENARRGGLATDQLDALLQRLEETHLSRKRTDEEAPPRPEGSKWPLAKKSRKKRKAHRALQIAVPSKRQTDLLLEHYHANRSDEAEGLAKVLTVTFPDYQLAWKILGSILHQAGRVEESLVPKKKAVELVPRDAEAHNNLGNAFTELHSFEEAEKHFRQSIALKFNYPEAHNNLGRALQGLGRRDEAEKHYRQAIALRPDFAQAHYGLGLTLEEVGSLEEAAMCWRRAISLKPDLPMAHGYLGNVLQRLGILDEAETAYRKAVVITPDVAVFHYNLGIVLKERGCLRDAEASYQQAIKLQPGYAEAHNNLGVTLQHLGRMSEAQESYKQAILLDPQYADPYFNAGLACRTLGVIDKAEQNFRRAVALRPDHTGAQLGLADIKKFRSRDDQFFQMLSLYRDPTISEENRCQICFALAKASDDMDDLASAFNFYAEGNALRKKLLGYSSQRDARLFSKLKASYPALSAHSLGADTVDAGRSPIFIVGMPRSGTTLVEQIVSSHPLVTGAGELPFVSQFGGHLAVGQTPVDSEALKTFRAQYLGAVEQRAADNAIVTDKMPQNFRFLGLILAAMPNAKIIHVKRDAAAVCWANYAQYFVGKLGYCWSLDDILHYHALYEDLMRFWHQVLPDKIYDLDYERLTEHQEEETRNLIDYLGLGWDRACLSPQDNERGVATASNIQVRKKVYKGSSERWKRYRPFLNGALDHLTTSGQ